MVMQQSAQHRNKHCVRTESSRVDTTEVFLTFRPHHIGIAVTSIDDTLQCLSGMFGSQKVSRFVAPIEHVEVCFVDIGGPILLELVQGVNEYSPVANILSEHGVVAYHICYQVEDLPAALQHLQANGHTITSRKSQSHAFLLSPDGQLVELAAFDISKFRANPEGHLCPINDYRAPTLADSNFSYIGFGVSNLEAATKNCKQSFGFHEIPGLSASTVMLHAGGGMHILLSEKLNLGAYCMYFSPTEHHHAAEPQNDQLIYWTDCHFENGLSKRHWWPRIRKRLGQVTPISRVADAVTDLESVWDHNKILKLISYHVDEVTGASVPLSAPLMQSGVTSRHVLILHAAIQSELQNAIQLPVTLMFDYPTCASMAGYIEAQINTKHVCTPSESLNHFSYRTGSDKLSTQSIARVCSTPGRCSSPGSLWNSLARAHQSAEKIPLCRFDVDALDGTASALSVKFGHFVHDVEMFDRLYFSMGTAEVMATDPQHRQFLQMAMKLCVASCRSKAALLNGSIGVFAGQCYVEWTHVQRDRNINITPFTAHGSDVSSASGRISYLFGLKGPAVAVNTACSSGLVALDAAVQATKRDSCRTAMALTVNLHLHRGGWICLCAVHVLATSGCSKTFDQSADGMGYSEGCTGVLIDSSDTFLAGPATGALGAAVRLAGSAVNQDGRSASFMAPNGLAQQAVIQEALGEQQINLHAETHGTVSIPSTRETEYSNCVHDCRVPL